MRIREIPLIILSSLGEVLLNCVVDFFEWNLCTAAGCTETPLLYLMIPRFIRFVPWPTKSQSQGRLLWLAGASVLGGIASFSCPSPSSLLI
jgi:hypothetical protein